MKVVLTLVLAAAVFVSAVQVVLAQHRARRLFAELTTLQETRDKLNEEWGRLQLEQSTWATADRIERLARTKLHMISPDVNSIVLLKR
ncbi:MAG: cell division protein FtsL [Gammaproteobacteria bacterium]|jgi:cell division protein FtsL